MQKSTFHVAQMDCAAEEQMVRMKLDGHPSVKLLEFDLPKRELTVWHTSEVAPITKDLSSLGLGARLLHTELSAEPTPPAPVPEGEQKLLWLVLSINAAFFVIEMTAGFLAHSMGLMADSLDMLADALVYGLSLWAVGGTTVRKKSIARLSGYFQLVLALLGFAEVVRRFLGAEAMPDFKVMMGVAFFALLGNSVSLYLLQKSKSQEAHMRASFIFTSNDVIANLGVILAGLLVYFTLSAVPDLVIGTVVFLLVARGAFRILNLAK
ncbi:cation transporter [Rufibacter quisquiliarum]|uniref:Co/Zn/Cd efflux system component n=1 Tax=Rufibacter quisquiliarum TaxID=1549639 RepID=A0A839GL61_9BACT|nr:cation transporter [Rufibacter quisquiliarum]MBA9077549.1 Co/Zn/Cd efflux system component [Rufibacter quisquiliarum]